MKDIRVQYSDPGDLGYLRMGRKRTLVAYQWVSYHCGVRFGLLVNMRIGARTSLRLMRPLLDY